MIVVLGAGMTGLAVARASGGVVYEAESAPGGICSSYYVSPRRAGAPPGAARRRRRLPVRDRRRALDLRGRSRGVAAASSDLGPVRAISAAVVGLLPGREALRALPAPEPSHATSGPTRRRARSRRCGRRVPRRAHHAGVARPELRRHALPRASSSPSTRSTRPGSTSASRRRTPTSRRWTSPPPPCGAVADAPAVGYNVTVHLSGRRPRRARAPRSPSGRARELRQAARSASTLRRRAVALRRTDRPCGYEPPASPRCRCNRDARARRASVDAARRTRTPRCWC